VAWRWKVPGLGPLKRRTLVGPHSRIPLTATLRRISCRWTSSRGAQAQPVGRRTLYIVVMGPSKQAPSALGIPRLATCGPNYFPPRTTTSATRSEIHRHAYLTFVITKQLVRARCGEGNTRSCDSSVTVSEIYKFTRCISFCITQLPTTVTDIFLIEIFTQPFTYNAQLFGLLHGLQFSTD